ncbi:transposase [Virgibacillus pantothenticus]|uniref:phage terminase small subunit n=1 Tax=Virgibacillus pantothenticus TaxID=1473 RepID=UPI001C249CC4|nr:phage terminase small subunit [Virgibacillus pantothenticus]MBU8567573.1 transposase [Virgibacillus pantothenticus]MBU8601361.1 transposase [Virgibacillus pantothenticus]MBU8636178.1 transposase [Virgibacillus pantothenticus]MBU8643698.1 transposase [Virgibacillus pantothenticus]MBU8648046.1 transposase [Virgibacillus pantothenticus]
MPRPRDPRREEAFSIWKESQGNKKLKDIAEELGVSPSTIRKWKSQDKWDTQLKGSAPYSNKSAPKRGAPKGNKNAKGNKGGGAPLGNQNAKGNRGGRPSFGNKNAVTTGEYETIMWDYLDDDEKELFESIETDPLYQIDVTIRELSIRQRRMMKRIKKLEDGLTEPERRVLQELKNTKDIHVVEKNGVQVKVPVKKSALVVTEIEETQYRKIDDILNIEEALTRITNQLVKAIKQKHDIQKSYGEQPLKEELLQANIDKTKAEVAKIEKDLQANTSTEDKLKAYFEALGGAFHDR